MAPRMKHTLDIQPSRPLPCIILERNLMGLFTHSQILFGVRMCVPPSPDEYFLLQDARLSPCPAISINSGLLGFRGDWVWNWGILIASCCIGMAGEVAGPAVVAGGMVRRLGCHPPLWWWAAAGQGWKRGSHAPSGWRWPWWRVAPLAMLMLPDPGGAVEEAGEQDSSRGRKAALHAGSKQRRQGWGLGQTQNYSSISLCLLVLFWTSRISRGCIVLVGQKPSSISEFRCFQI